ncbi:ABC transporter ATP-binding protein [Ideonella sp.]|uniref:ABC transporter ATP-binding protein n=1 Tax=Ideonella sp. TaxID=1929293 RepID=UPI0035B28E07
MTAPAALRAAPPRLHARGLHVQLAGRAVLHGVDAVFEPGWTAVVGPNGAGKSTLLRALAGLVPAAAGQVTLDGRRLGTMPLRERACRIAWLAQAGPVSGELTVLDTVRLGRLAPLGLFAEPDAQDEAAVARAMQATGCADWAGRRLHGLSGGERQRVLLARALATGAPVLLLDEPTAHLDPPHQVALVQLLRRLAATHTVVSVLHELNLALCADRLLLLEGGRGTAAGRSDDPALHAAVQEAFDHTVQIQRHAGRWAALPCLPAIETPEETP